MAVSYVKEVGFVTNTTNTATSTITVAAGGVPVGDCVVIYGACDNSVSGGTPAVTITVTDARSNSYTTQTPIALRDPGSENSGVQGFFAITRVTTELQASDVITITYGNSITAAKGITAQQFSGIHPTLPVLPGSYTTATGGSTTPSVTTVSHADAAGQAVLALIGIEGPTSDTYTADSDTTNGSWVHLTERGSGSAATAITVQAAYKLVSAGGSQTFNATITSRDWAAAILVLDQGGTAGTVTGAAVVPTPTISTTSPSGVFAYTGGYWDYTVPFAVTTIIVDAYGAQGGPDGAANDFGAEGGRVKCDVTVTPGEILRVYVGGKPTGQLGGFNNGWGDAGTSAGGGGGSSDVRRTPYAVANRLVVAGGGGGAGRAGIDNVGGVGGTPAGGTGTAGSGGQGGGTGGTASAVGAGGDGTLLDGANGFNEWGGGGGALGGGGGGGGYWGGGGGGCGTSNGGGGGGGSGLSTGVNETLTSGARTGHGEVTIDFVGELILPPTVEAAVSIPAVTILGAEQTVAIPVVTVSTVVPAVSRILLPFPSPVVTIAAVVPAPTIKRGDTVMPGVVTVSAVVNTPTDFLSDHTIFPATVDAG